MTLTRYENSPIPLTDKVVGTGVRGEIFPHGILTKVWTDWFSQITNRLGVAVTNVASSPRYTAQTASVGPVNVSEGSLPGGLYGIHYYAQIEVPATVNSSLTVTITWTTHTVTQTFTGAAINGNTTTDHQSGDFTIRMDSASPISYTLTYASVGATAMQYGFDLLVEELGR